MKVRKKPVIVEAKELTSESYGLIMSWISKHNDEIYRIGQDPEQGLIIPTLEGPVLVRYGDWVIQGIAGEFYPVKPEIFYKSHEVADNGQ